MCFRIRPNLALAGLLTLLTALLTTAPLRAQPCIMLVPELDAVVPAEAEALTDVTLEGFGFQFGICLESVTFGGAPSPNTQFIDAFTMIVTVPDLAPGTYNVRVTTIGGQSGSVPFTIPSAEPDFIRGDCNQDGGFDIADAIAKLAALFESGSPSPTCQDACDANDDGLFDISDPIFVLGNLFTLGPDPSAPFPECGPDPTDDGAGCESFAGCP